ncbi:hypothetical protein AgCh_004964 [Apium graveolens]
MEESYWESMKYGIADMVNTGGRQGGSITAALFLKQSALYTETCDALQMYNYSNQVYVVVLFIGITNASSVQPVVCVERSVSYRERAGMYSTLPFALAQGAGGIIAGATSCITTPLDTIKTQL